MTAVGVIKALGASYRKDAPFDPPEEYPEYPFGSPSLDENAAYAAVRDLFQLLGYDKENFGTPEWNPLGFLIKPGMTVVLKPNFVLSRHFAGGDLFSIVTHPSVLRAIADYCFIALKDAGKVIIADAPQYNCNWAELSEAAGLDALKEFYSRTRPGRFDVVDLRNYWSRGKHFPSLKESLEGDPGGTLEVDLGEESEVSRIANPERLYGAVYHRQETIAGHSDGTHKYQLSRTVMDADVVICVPKLKVHKKVGVTLNIKGLVGINTNKNLIVHYRVGSPDEGGDQYPPGHFTPMEERLIRTERWMYDTFLARQNKFLEYIHRSIYFLHGKLIKPFGIRVEREKRKLDAGNWHGNDSAWRMSVDLIKLFLFTGKDGKMHDTPQRRVFSIVDGIIGGDGEGPLTPDAVSSGVLIGGENLLAVDIAATRLMGFDPARIRTFEHLLRAKDRDFGISGHSDITVRSNEPDWRDILSDKRNRYLGFRPHPGWVGQVEAGKDQWN